MSMLAALLLEKQNRDLDSNWTIDCYAHAPPPTVCDIQILNNSWQEFISGHIRYDTIRQVILFVQSNQIMSFCIDHSFEVTPLYIHMDILYCRTLDAIRQ